MAEKYNIHILSNGLRLVVWHLPGLVNYFGAIVAAGSRDEAPDKQGLAHFVEHTIFKGTSSRKAWQISNRMECVGGELNAYTSKDETAIYTNAPAGHEERAIELVADLISDSLFPPQELEKEKDVVIEEIHSYEDSPADSVFDEFEELLYEGSGLAHNILGTPESVRNLTSADCRGFIDSFYTPADMTLYAAGPADPDLIVRLVEKYFLPLHFASTPKHRSAPPLRDPFHISRDLGNHQANTIVGATTFGRRDIRRPALLLLNNYLGGPCMNSRLNHELRDKRGYVYTVESSVSMYDDTGALFIYFGCDPANVDKCTRLVHRELDRLAQSPLSATALNAMKRQYCGQLTVTTDHRESRAMALAKSLMYFDRICDVESMIDLIMDVSAEQIREVAEIISPQRCSSLTLT